MTFRLFLPLAIVLLLTSCTTTSRIPTADSAIVVTDGAIHRHAVRNDGPWNIHSVSIDLKKLDIDIVSARAFDSLRGRETTSSMAQRKSNDEQTVLASVNADFFTLATGENELNQVIDGEIVKGVKKPLRAQFALGFSRSPYIEKFVFNGEAITPYARFEIDAVNNLKDSSAIVLLNHFFGMHTRGEHERAVVLRTLRPSNDTTVTVLHDTLSVNEMFTATDSFQLLRANGAKENSLAQMNIGDTVSLVLGFLPKRERLKTVVGGLPQIVVDGENIAANDSITGVSRKFSETRHPRTGVGFSRSGTAVYFVTVDGRQQSSAGMSLCEFADLMIELGCYQGLNLDGGGSTTMVVNGKVVNFPSDAKGERAVANALLVVKKIR